MFFFCFPVLNGSESNDIMPMFDAFFTRSIAGVLVLALEILFFTLVPPCRRFRQNFSYSLKTGHVNLSAPQNEVRRKEGCSSSNKLSLRLE
jgi:hypothetical protein